MAASKMDLCFCSPLELHECALCHLRRGEYREALAPLGRLTMAIARDSPGAAVIWATLAHVYNRLGRRTRAAMAARRALEVAPNFMQARHELVVSRGPTATQAPQ